MTLDCYTEYALENWLWLPLFQFNKEASDFSVCTWL